MLPKSKTGVSPMTRTLLMAAMVVTTGCNAILGVSALDYNPSDSGPSPHDAGPDVTSAEGSVSEDASSEDASPDAYVSDDASDASDAGTDALTIPDVGPPGNPGLAVTAGGTYSKSAHFQIIGALGESPGGNLTAQSPKFKLYSGIIGATGN
jgi:hypothetical protein